MCRHRSILIPASVRCKTSVWACTGGKHNAAEDAPAHGRQHARGRKGGCRQAGLCRELPADHITPGGPGAAGACQYPALPGLPGFPARTRYMLLRTLSALLDAALQGTASQPGQGLRFSEPCLLCWMQHCKVLTLEIQDPVPVHAAAQVPRQLSNSAPVCTCRQG